MLKKIILIYHIIIGLYSTVVSLFLIVGGTYKSWYFIWVLIGVLLVVVSAKALLDLNLSKYNKFFFLFNLPQIITISLFGYVYKFILGSELFLYFKNHQDSIITFQYRYFFRDFYLDEVSDTSFVFIGINIVQLFIAGYFWYHMPNKEKKLKEWFKSQ